MPREQLRAAKLWDYLIDAYVIQESFDSSTDTFHAGREPLDNYYINNKEIIITYPAHDSTADDMENENNSARLLNEVLQKTKKLLEVDKTILVPISQTRRVFGFRSRRGHFTMLEIHKNENGRITATHHDSKGWLSTIMYALRIYSLAPIERAVRDVFTDQVVTFNHHESGSQSMKNNVDCGRFVIDGINQIITEEARSPGQRLTTITEEKLAKIENEIESSKVKNSLVVKPCNPKFENNYRPKLINSTSTNPTSRGEFEMIDDDEFFNNTRTKPQAHQNLNNQYQDSLRENQLQQSKQTLNK
jgi:hypothetical protein